MNNNSSKWASFLNAHVPWLIMMLLITVQSSLTSELLSVKIPKGVDKIIHFTIFGFLGWLMTRGFLMTEKLFLKKHFFWLIPSIGAIFAIIDEFHQALVPGRSPDFYDWVADFLGIVVFMFLYKKKNPILN